MERKKYELILSMAMLTNRGLQKGTDCEASLNELKNNLKKERDNLKESLEIYIKALS